MKNPFHIIFFAFILSFVFTTGYSQRVDTVPAKVVLKLLGWYAINYQTLNKIRLVDHYGNPKDTLPYSVNFEQAEQYLSGLRKSGCLSDIYISDLREYFKKCDANFKKEPQIDGPPEGLDFDLLLWSNSDFPDELRHLDSAKSVQTEIHRRTAIVIIEFISGRRLSYTLSKNKTIWQIDAIKNLGGPY
jgi:hypothetical protein